jgi:phage pi2 protein 07
LTALFASTALLSVVGAQSRYGSGGNTGSDMSLSVDFQTFELDGQVHDMLWCGSNDEIILVQSSDGTVYRSRDRGLSWKRLKSLMMKHAGQVADENQDIGKVHKMLQSPVDDQLVVFLGTNGINWVSEDCGGNLSALNSGKRIQEFLFHPTQRNWALAASWTTCAEFEDEPCRIFKELYYTKDTGEEWNYITNYVFDFEWGQSKMAKDNSVQIPDDRIWLTRDDTNTKHQSHSKKISWSTNIDLYMSDDYFATSPVMALEQGNTIIKTP